jgi:RNA polymerase sigma factor (sigma-70 family)
MTPAAPAYPLVAASAVWPLWREYFAGRSPDVARRLADHYLPLVDRVARHVKRRSLPFREFDVLLADGTIGLMAAIRGYDPRRNDRFEPWAWPNVRGWILHGYLKERGERPKALSIGRDDEQGRAANEPWIDGRHEQAAADARLDYEAAFARLPARHRDVCRLRFFEGLTLHDIHERVGVSRERVRQILKEAEGAVGRLMPYLSIEGNGRCAPHPVPAAREAAA